MSQCVVESLGSVGKNEQNEEQKDHFIAETAKLAQLIAEKKDTVLIQNECHVIRPANETKQLLTSNGSLDDLNVAAKDVAESLCNIAGTYDRQLSNEFDNRTGEDIDYATFRTICSNVLSSTMDTIANRGNQILLVFASYFRLTSTQNTDLQTSRYVGQYLSDVGLQSWIQLQGGWQNMRRILSNIDAPLNPQGTAV